MTAPTPSAPTPIEIHGSRFKGVGYSAPSSIHIGPTDGPTNVTNIVIVSDTLITCVAPKKDPSWPNVVGIWITNPYGVGVRVGAFRYHIATLRIDSIDPPYGLYTGHEPVVIRGSGFLGSGIGSASRAQFLHYGEIHDLEAFVVISDTEIHANTPPGVQYQTLALRVVADGQIGYAAQVAYLGDPAAMNAFKYDIPSLYGDTSPSIGTWTGGEVVTLTRLVGQGLYRNLVSATVYQVGSLQPPYPIAFTFIDDNHVSFTMPNANTAGASPQVNGGAVDVRFRDASGAIKALAYFIYSPMRVFSMTNPVQVGGERIDLEGTSLNTITQVLIQDNDGVVADKDVTGSFVADSSTAAHVQAPDLTGIVHGRLSITGIFEVGRAAIETVSTTFTVHSGLEPIVYTSTPLSGDRHGSTPIVIRGLNFQRTPGVDDATAVTLVRDGGGPGSIPFTVISDTEIHATVPAGLSFPNARFAIRVTTPHGAATGPYDVASFTYSGPPQVMSYTPTSGPAGGGTIITIQVNTSLNCTGANVGGVAVTGFSIVDATHVRGTTGPHVAAAVEVHVINSTDGESSAGAGFTYV